MRGFVWFLCLYLPINACAHELWLTKEGSGYALLQGHRHAGAHAGAHLVPYPASAVKRALCLGSAGAWQPIAIGKSYPVRLSGRCAATRVTFSSGYWSKTPWGTKNLPKSQVSAAISSWLSEENLTRIGRGAPAPMQPTGDGLELLPTTNPLAVAVGETLALRVTDSGHPKAGVSVIYGGQTATTAEDGTVSIRLRHSGLQLFSASSTDALNDGLADTRTRTASLQFETVR